MLSDAIHKSYADSQKLLDVARVKAAQPTISEALGASHEGLTGKRSAYDSSRDQLTAFRGNVYTAVNKIAARCARQPIRVAVRGATPTKPMGFKQKQFMPPRLKAVENLEPLETHPILELLEKPNPDDTPFALVYRLVASLMLTGRSLLWVTVEDEGDDNLCIVQIPSDWIDDADRKRDKWTIRIPGRATTFDIPGDEVCYFFWPDPADRWGHKSPVGAQAEAVDAEQAISDVHARTFRQGQFGNVVIKTGGLPDPNGGTMPVTLTREQRKQVVADIKKFWQGAANYGEPLICDNGLVADVQRLSMTPQELDFKSSYGLVKERILQSFSVSEILLGAKDANRASSYEARRIFYDNTINPLLELMSQALTKYLGPMFGKGQKLCIYFEEAIPDDEEMSLKKWGLVKADTTINERRAFNGLPPIEGGDELPALMPAVNEPGTDEAETDTPATAPADVQATALNGAQTDSLLNIVDRVSQGTMGHDTARALLAAAYPMMSTEQVNAIVDSIEVKPVNETQTNQPETSSSPDDEQPSNDASEDDETAEEIKAFVRSINPYNLQSHD